MPGRDRSTESGGHDADRSAACLQRSGERCQRDAVSQRQGDRDPARGQTPSQALRHLHAVVARAPAPRNRGDGALRELLQPAVPQPVGARVADVGDGRVHELDAFEVGDDPVLAGVHQLEDALAQPGGGVRVDLAADVEDFPRALRAGVEHKVDREHPLGSVRVLPSYTHPRPGRTRSSGARAYAAWAPIRPPSLRIASAEPMCSARTLLAPSRSAIVRATRTTRC